jgi:hypothetical protein
LYAVSRSSSVSSRRPRPFTLADADPLAEALPSSSAPVEDDAEEAVREAEERGRILKMAGGTMLGVSTEDDVVGAKETEGDEAIEGEGEGDAAVLRGARMGAGEDGSGAGTKLASLAEGLHGRRQQVLQKEGAKKSAHSLVRSPFTKTTTPCGCPVAGLIAGPPAFQRLDAASTSRVMPKMSARRWMSSRWYELRAGWKWGGARGSRVALRADKE